MIKKEWLVKVTVNNSGLDFEDDVDTIVLVTDASVEQHTIAVALDKADHLLRKEDEEGECEYNELGWNACVLMEKVCEITGWEWYSQNPDIEFTIG